MINIDLNTITTKFYPMLAVAGKPMIPKLAKGIINNEIDFEDKPVDTFENIKDYLNNSTTVGGARYININIKRSQKKVKRTKRIGEKKNRTHQKNKKTHRSN